MNQGVVRRHIAKTSHMLVADQFLGMDRHAERCGLDGDRVGEDGDVTGDIHRAAGTPVL